MGELAMMLAGGAVGFFVGYGICAIFKGGRIEALKEELATYTDRDEKGRFKKSMRQLKND